MYDSFVDVLCEHARCRAKLCVVCLPKHTLDITDNTQCMIALSMFFVNMPDTRPSSVLSACIDITDNTQCMIALSMFFVNTPDARPNSVLSACIDITDNTQCMIALSMFFVNTPDARTLCCLHAAACLPHH